SLPYSLTQKTINAAPFNASDVAGVMGSLSFALDSSSGAVSRDIWISKCAGGPAVHELYCARRGALTTTIRWAVGGANGSRCALEPGESYFLNIQNMNNTCHRTSGCSMLVSQATSY